MLSASTHRSVRIEWTVLYVIKIASVTTPYDVEVAIVNDRGVGVTCGRECASLLSAGTHTPIRVQRTVLYVIKIASVTTPYDVEVAIVNDRGVSIAGGGEGGCLLSASANSTVRAKREILNIVLLATIRATDNVEIAIVNDRGVSTTSGSKRTRVRDSTGRTNIGRGA